MNNQRFYICSMSGRSGVDKYAKEFYENILRPKGYQFVDSSHDTHEILSLISSRDIVHFEIGLFQTREADLMLRMLRLGYRDIRVTLHDPPVVRYPSRQVHNPVLNLLARLNDLYLGGLKSLRPCLEKIRHIYVLSRTGAALMKKTYQLTNVHFLPHYVYINADRKPADKRRNFIYLGFVGRNKGLEYALKLHRNYLKYSPDTEFIVVGTAIGKQIQYFEQLKKEYQQKVSYLGYVEDSSMVDTFRNTSFALLGFQDYKWYCPVSGSILYCMQNDNLVLTNPVNAITEIISDGYNGFYLQKNIEEDTKKILHLNQNSDQFFRMISASRQYLADHHSEAAVLKHFND